MSLTLSQSHNVFSPLPRRNVNALFQQTLHPLLEDGCPGDEVPDDSKKVPFCISFYTSLCSVIFQMIQLVGVLNGKSDGEETLTCM